MPSLHSLFPAERKVHFPLCSGERGNHHGLDFSLFHTYNPGAGIGAMGIAIVYLKAHKKISINNEERVKDRSLRFRNCSKFWHGTLCNID